jgi:dTDP-4-dehydrorhamnose reductase
MNNILIFGASGQLGNCIKKVSSEKKIENLIFLSKEESDILDEQKLKTVFASYQPAFIINCAAYTAVDKAEDDVELARKINQTGAKNLALKCKEYGAVMVHVSTDFVFDGNHPKVLEETDITQPINVYGLTKLEGESEIAQILPAHFIIRTSWLYSEYGNNFVKTMLKLGAEREELKIISDQIGTPTYAIDLAHCILYIVSTASQDYGIYHYSNEGACSWYDFAKAVFDISGTSIKVLPIRTHEYPTKATRPLFSVMDKSKIKKTFNLEIPYWRDSLINCIENLKPKNI